MKALRAASTSAVSVTDEQILRAILMGLNDAVTARAAHLGVMLRRTPPHDYPQYGDPTKAPFPVDITSRGEKYMKNNTPNTHKDRIVLPVVRRTIEENCFGGCAKATYFHVDVKGNSSLSASFEQVAVVATGLGSGGASGMYAFDGVDNPPRVSGARPFEQRLPPAHGYGFALQQVDVTVYHGAKIFAKDREAAGFGGLQVVFDTRQGYPFSKLVQKKDKYRAEHWPGFVDDFSLPLRIPATTPLLSELVSARGKHGYTKRQNAVGGSKAFGSQYKLARDYSLPWAPVERIGAADLLTSLARETIGVPPAGDSGLVNHWRKGLEAASATQRDHFDRKYKMCELKRTGIGSDL